MSKEIKITFTGGLGKTALLLTAAKLYEALGHKVTLAHTYMPCSMKISLHEGKQIDESAVKALTSYVDDN